MEADEANNVKDIVIEEANGALGGEVSSSVDVSLNESTPGNFLAQIELKATKTYLHTHISSFFKYFNLNLNLNSCKRKR